MAGRGRAPDGSKTERRKANRFAVTVPIEVSWRGPDGIAIKEQAIARQVNMNGGLLEMAHYPEIGMRVSLTNFLSAETAEARVLGTPSSREGVSSGIVIELTSASEAFWGVGLQMKKTSIELQKLEARLLAEAIDPRLLNEFRESVDHIRLIAGSVQQFRERQLHDREDNDVVQSLTTDRINRGKLLCLELATDLDNGKIDRDTKGIEDLYHMLDRVYSDLAAVLSPPRDPGRGPGRK